MKIKYIVETTSSKADKFGNSYSFAKFTNCETGNVAIGLVDSYRNAELVPMSFGCDYSNIYRVNITLPIREYYRKAKGLPYIGCNPEEIAETIKVQLH